MFSVEGTGIELVRGDTLILSLSIKQGDEDYIPNEGDVIHFALKRNSMNKDKTAYLDKTPLVEKEIPIDTLILRLDSEDTSELAFGKYAYDISITMANGIVDTFISGVLTLRPEVG